jgi:hypothetical protein
VKNRCQADLNEKVTVAKSREQESTFFDDHAIFKDLDPDKAGTEALIASLASIQTQAIAKALPEIQEKVFIYLNESREQLSKLSEIVPEDRRIRHTRDLVDKLVQAAQDFRGKPEFCSKLHKSFAKLHKRIFATQDIFKAEGYRKRLQKEASRNRRDELPLFPSFDVARQKIMEFVDKWREPCHELVEEIIKLLTRELLKLVKNLFGAWPKLERLVKSETKNAIQEVKEKMLTSIDESLDATAKTPHTQNDYYEETYKSILVAEMLPSESILSKISNIGDPTELKKIMGSQLTKSIDKGEFGALQIFASVSAFWKVAYKKEQDVACDCINLGLKNLLEIGLKEKLHDMIEGKMEKVKKFLQEDPQTAAKRNMLDKKIKVLAECSFILEEQIMLSGAIDESNEDEEEIEDSYSYESKEVESDEDPRFCPDSSAEF